METLEQFIKSNPPPLELKRALAVQMSHRGQSYRQIRDLLQVSIGFVSACCQRYKRDGVKGLHSRYWGTQGYLSAQQRQELLSWLQQQDYWTLEEVMDQLEDTYGVVYRSQQSYYALLKQAGFSWKKAQPIHPHQDEMQIEKKKLKLWNFWQRGEPRLPVDSYESCS